MLIYLLQTIACSGMLYCYYRIALYNRAHHQWNRFFLLCSVCISIILPLIKIPIPVPAEISHQGIVQILSVIPGETMHEETVVFTGADFLDLETILLRAYALVCITIWFHLLQSLVRLFRLSASYPKQNFNGIRISITEDNNGPFTFFKTIFWNKNIDVNSHVGSRMFAHEKVHVDQLHTVDRLIVQIVLVIFWCNPFYWLIKKELIVLHEFLADSKAIQDNDPKMLSEMILISAFPGKSFAVTSSFSNSSIKRRLSMLTINSKAKASNLGKWLALPVIILLFSAFCMYKKPHVASLNDTFSVMIDAGHGGSRNGAIGTDGTKEKDLTLAIAKKIKALNKDEQIKIIMSREYDEDASVGDRVNKATQMNLDAFLSIHINRQEATRSGIQFVMTNKPSPFASKSQLLGSLLSQELKKVYNVDGALRIGADQGVWVLDAPEINYPSLLIEFGNLLNPEDLAFIKSDANQEKVAAQVLSGIRLFAQQHAK